MHETDITNQLIAQLRGAGGVVAFKHADRFTAGMPDISVTGAGRTAWLEVKRIKAARSREDERWPWRVRLDRRAFELQQLVMAENLYRASVGRCQYVIFIKLPGRPGHTVAFVDPARLLDLLRPNGLGARDLYVTADRGTLTDLSAFNETLYDACSSARAAELIIRRLLT